MSGLPWELRGISSHVTGQAEVEALQTDLMRFMAILGLCLMAVFALVQGLPAVPGDARPRLARPALPERAVSRLEERVQALKVEAARLQAEVTRAGGALATTRAELSAARDEAREARGDAAEAKALRGRMVEEAAEIQRELRAQRNRLQTIKGQVRAQQLSRRELQASLDREQAAADRSEARVDAVRQVVKVDPPSPARVRPERVGGEGGFTLRFESADALRALVSAGRVGFIALVNERAWRLSVDGQRARFETARQPERIHEMTPGTVPADYVEAFRRDTAVFRRTGVVWGVTLPPGMRDALRRLMASARGGQLVIGADGSVRAERGG